MSRLKDNKIKNGGYSFIEIAVVVLIFGIAASGVVIGMNRLFSSNTSSCANIISSNLENARIETMSKEEGTIIFKLYYNNSDGYTYLRLDGTSQQPERLLKDESSIGVIYTDGSTEAVKEGTSIDICFDKTTGVYIDNAAGKRVKTIVINGAYKYYVQLVIDTGRNYIQQE